jgi:hypothetical protein
MRKYSRSMSCGGGYSQAKDLRKNPDAQKMTLVSRARKFVV